jgi:antitoxin VapB
VPGQLAKVAALAAAGHGRLASGWGRKLSGTDRPRTPASRYGSKELLEIVDIRLCTGKWRRDHRLESHFRSGNSEAVRLPKDVAFGKEMEVTIVRSGDVLTIYPKRTSLQEMVARLRRLPSAGDVGRRDEDVVPDRSGDAKCWTG